VLPVHSSLLTGGDVPIPFNSQAPIRPVPSRLVRRIVQAVLGFRNWFLSEQASNGVALRDYMRDDGSFDYEKYRKKQTAGNKRKIYKVWVKEENIEFLADYIKRTIDSPTFGICHGTRRGKEQKWFSRYLECEVLGTEISDTADQFPNTIQWDFHEVKREWIEKCDFIYSNSLDHAYDPEKALNAWMSCVRPGGLCILEHTSEHEPGAVTDLDPFGAHLALMPYLVTTWGGGRYFVREILRAPKDRLDVKYTFFLVVQRL
jgi:SAM-dependent methyltransferase